MENVLRLQASVLPGHRLEIVAPELPEQGLVDVTIVIPQSSSETSLSLASFLRSLPPGPRSAGTWEEIEQSIPGRDSSGYGSIGDVRPVLNQ